MIQSFREEFFLIMNCLQFYVITDLKTKNKYYAVCLTAQYSVSDLLDGLLFPAILDRQTTVFLWTR